VGHHTKSFATALRAALREDPDIILVGEMRDLETIELAITAAETGHLVFGTLHTNSAAKTVDRIINVFPTAQQEQIRAMLAESLRGVIAQQLLKTVDGKRCAALEILSVTPAVSNLIREGKTFQIPSVIQTGKAEGMQLMDQAIQALLAAKKITVEEAQKFAANKSLFQSPATGSPAHG
jgi:twitching motility protein PilT